MVDIVEIAAAIDMFDMAIREEAELEQRLEAAKQRTRQADHNLRTAIVKRLEESINKKQGTERE